MKIVNKKLTIKQGVHYFQWMKFITFMTSKHLAYAQTGFTPSNISVLI